ncbi:MAG: hypothetical protein MZV64_00195 [Ignavibacteriales bacterium]|nr:hypothetical protein [Ignavibacteriales bacterium]
MQENGYRLTEARRAVVEAVRSIPARASPVEVFDRARKISRPRAGARSTARSKNWRNSTSSSACTSRADARRSSPPATGTSTSCSARTADRSPSSKATTSTRSSKPSQPRPATRSANTGCNCSVCARLVDHFRNKEYEPFDRSF